MYLMKILDTKPIEISTSKVCHTYIKAEIKPMAMGPFGDMISPPEGLGEEFEDKIG